MEIAHTEVFKEHKIFTSLTYEHLPYKVTILFTVLSFELLGETDLLQLKEYFGSSHEFIKSFTQNYTSDLASGRNAFIQELHLLASCKYETGTKWGQEVTGLYLSITQLLR